MRFLLAHYYYYYCRTRMCSPGVSEPPLVFHRCSDDSTLPLFGALGHDFPRASSGGTLPVHKPLDI